METLSDASVTLADKTHADVVVVGSGPGGAVTACLLAEAGRDVLLLEEGPSLAITDTEPFSRGELERKYRNGGVTVALGTPPIAYAEGRCLGGGSEVNSGLYHRTPAEILEDWQTEYGLNHVTGESMTPHFEACEHDLSVSLLPYQAPPASLKLRDGAEALGWQSIEVPRWYRYENGGGEHRQSMTETYLPRAARAGCRIVPATRAHLIRSDSGRFTIRCKQTAPAKPPRQIDILAATVILACGAVQTPALLRRSGIRTNVGRTLRFHPTVKVIARFPEKVNHPGMGVPVHQVKEFSPRIGLGCAISQPAHLALAMLDHREAGPEVVADWPHHAAYYAMTRGGTGSVSALPFFADPLVRFRLSESDLGELAHGLRRLCSCLLAAGADVLYPTVRGLGPFRNESDLDQIPAVLPRETSLMTIHAFSTCPMGEMTERAAANSFGEVHQAPGLRIADASLLCSPPGVNPQGSVMAFARRNALALLGEEP